MERKHTERKFLQQSYWLVLALACVIFSGAFKRLLEFDIQKKVNGQFAAAQFVNKKIKDGSRDKRQYLIPKVKLQKLQPHDNDGLDCFTTPANTEVVFSVRSPHRVLCQAPFSVIHLQAVTPLYLLHHRLQV